MIDRKHPKTKIPDVVGCVYRIAPGLIVMSERVDNPDWPGDPLGFIIRILSSMSADVVWDCMYPTEHEGILAAVKVAQPMIDA